MTDFTGPFKCAWTLNCGVCQEIFLRRWSAVETAQEMEDNYARDFIAHVRIIRNDLNANLSREMAQSLYDFPLTTYLMAIMTSRSPFHWPPAGRWEHKPAG